MTLLALGISHRTLSVEQREKAALSCDAARGLLRELIASRAVSEAVALSTCNRTEIYVSSPDPDRAEAVVARALVAHTRIAPDELASARYLLRDEGAATQLFRVASSLDSMVIGESEIQGQVRDAWELAVDEGCTGQVIDRLFRQALEVGKQVRTATRIGAGSASISAVAVELAADAVDDLPGRRVLVIGAGQVAEATVRSLVRRGARDVAVVNRTAGAARELAGRIGGRGAGFDRLAEELALADIVISSTDAPNLILRPAAIGTAMSSRAERPMVIVDISVPRDVHAGAAAVAGVALFDIDDLARVAEAGLNGRRVEAQRGEGYVIGAVRAFAAWRRGLQAAPAITALRARAEDIRRSELARLVDEWDDLSDTDRRRLDALTRRMVTKLMHEPTVRLRAAAEAGDATRVADLQHLLGLELPFGVGGSP